MKDISYFRVKGLAFQSWKPLSWQLLTL